MTQILPTFMNMYAAWKLLEEPSTLFRFCFASNEHTVQITDLSSVWCETLLKEQILLKAQDEDCSIDPSQDDEQYGILVEKLHDCLRSHESPDCSLELSQSGRDVALTLECALPRPLRPLRWVWRLKFMDQSALRSLVLMPLAASSFVQLQRIERLYQLIHEKDSALANILDKMDSTNLDLTSIFPQAATIRPGRKSSKKEHILRSVKGLQPFSQQEWTRNSVPSMRDSASGRLLLDTAFSGTDDHSVCELLETIKSFAHSKHTKGPALNDTKAMATQSSQQEELYLDFQVTRFLYRSIVSALY